MAIILEVMGTLLLPISQNFTRLIPTLALCISYVSSFYFLSLALNSLPIAVVYATWSGLGIFLITIFGFFIFKETLDWRAIVGLLLIVGGVILLNAFSLNK